MLAQKVPQYDIKQDPLGYLWTQIRQMFLSFAVNFKLPLVILFLHRTTNSL